MLCDNLLIMLLDELHTKKAMIESVASFHGATRIRVFGSVARREERIDSDVDFLVNFPHGYDLFAQRLPLAEKLTSMIGRKIDLIPEHELSRHIREDVIKESQYL